MRASRACWTVGPEEGMSDLELTLSALCDAAALAICAELRPKSPEEMLDVAMSGGEVAAMARKEVERRLGRSITG